MAHTHIMECSATAANGKTVSHNARSVAASIARCICATQRASREKSIRRDILQSYIQRWFVKKKKIADARTCTKHSGHEKVGGWKRNIQIVGVGFIVAAKKKNKALTYE